MTAYKGLNITYDSAKIEPEKNIKNTAEYRFTIKEKNSDIQAGAKIIEWIKGNYKQKFLCDPKGIAYDEMPLNLNTYGIPISIYIKSPYIKELFDENILQLKDLDDTCLKIIEKADDITREYIRKVLAEHAAKEIEEIKKEELYPYEGEPKDILEEAERDVFDICAVQIHKFVPGFDNTPGKARKLTYQLVKEAINRNPTSLSKILTEVLNLKKQEQDEFAELLEEASLSAIINTTKTIIDRLKVLNGLDQILHTNKKKGIKERSQLHKILIRELWIFGEKYMYGADDVSLKIVLKE